MAGTLYLVATPIGNLGDITLRALDTLKQADLVAAEDTRVSGKLLAHYQIRKPLISYYEQNKLSRASELLAALAEEKNIALVCDAGTPCISDPGSDLVRAAIGAGYEVIAIPGASALLTGLTASGLDNGAFCFEGFLPRQKRARLTRLTALTEEKRVMVFYEAPHRLRAMLADLTTVFGGTRAACACRELTKLYEEKQRANLAELCLHFSTIEPRGEFTIIVAGAEEELPQEPDMEQIEAELTALLASGIARKQASKQLAEKYQLPAKEIYRIGLSS